MTQSLVVDDAEEDVRLNFAPVNAAVHALGAKVVVIRRHMVQQAAGRSVRCVHFAHVILALDLVVDSLFMKFSEHVLDAAKKRDFIQKLTYIH